MHYMPGPEHLLRSQHSEMWTCPRNSMWECELTGLWTCEQNTLKLGRNDQVPVAENKYPPNTREQIKRKPALEMIC